jgi:hypothetical protein
MVFGHEFADTASDRSALRMHGWRYPAYRYRVARPRAALFAGEQNLGAPPNLG